MSTREPLVLLVDARAHAAWRPRATASAHVDRPAVDLDPPGLDARDVEQVVDEVDEPVGRQLDDVDELALALVRPPRRTSSSTKPLIDVSGLRSSCEAVATNSLLSRSSRARSVASRTVHTMPAVVLERRGGDEQRAAVALERLLHRRHGIVFVSPAPEWRRAGRSRICEFSRFPATENSGPSLEPMTVWSEMSIVI